MGQRALKGRACGRTAGNWCPDLPWSQVYQSLLVTSCCSTTMECISGCTYCFIVFDDEDKGRLTKIQRVKKTKVKTTRALLRWDLRVSGVGVIVYIYMCVWAWLWGPKVSIPKLMEAKGFVEAVRWKEHSERPRHIKYIEIDPFHLWSCRNPIQIPAPTLREYPKGLGKSLVKIYRELNISEKPLACLRQKAETCCSWWIVFVDLGPVWRYLELNCRTRNSRTG